MKGKGFEFADIKPFESGDDPRDIDVRRLVQTGKKFIIRRVMDRQRAIIIWADFSGSMQLFEKTFFASKSDVRDIAIGICLFSARAIGSPAGFYAFDSEIRKNFSPQQGEGHCWQIIKWIIDHGAKLESSQDTDFRAILDYANKHTPSESIVFFISDFMADIFDGNFSDLMKPLFSKCDFIPVVIRDPLEKSMPPIKRPLRVCVEENEGRSREVEIELTPETLQNIHAVSEKHLQNLRINFKRAGIDFVVLESPEIEDCFRTLARFLLARQRMHRR